MSDSLLTLVQNACNEMGLTAPSSVVSNTDTQVVQYLALANRVGRNLMREYDWQKLQTEYRFNTVSSTVTGTTTSGSTTVSSISDTSGIQPGYLAAGPGFQADTHVVSVDSSTQVTVDAAATSTNTGVSLQFGQDAYPLPSDWDRQINRTDWDKTKRWELMGPKEPQEWQWLKSGIISTGPRLRYRIYGGNYNLWPVPDNGSRLGYEYISKNWVTSSSGTGQSTFQADTDTCVFPDELMTVGIKLRFFAVKGFDTTAFQQEYMRLLMAAKANDHGAATLSTAPRMSSVLLTPLNIPDSGYGNS